MAAPWTRRRRYGRRRDGMAPSLPGTRPCSSVDMSGSWRQWWGRAPRRRGEGRSDAPPPARRSRCEVRRLPPSPPRRLLRGRLHPLLPLLPLRPPLARVGAPCARLPSFVSPVPHRRPPPPPPPRPRLPPPPRPPHHCAYELHMLRPCTPRRTPLHPPPLAPGSTGAPPSADRHPLESRVPPHSIQCGVAVSPRAHPPHSTPARPAFG
mmetsp:Transcript_14617/g.46650  ORF Transcript_14617/g.46650 Transcript_14617/m.46650 type:complete len:208 (+) Transcript_14617:50-673(+)